MYSATYQHSHNLSASQFPLLENRKKNSFSYLKNDLTNNMMNYMVAQMVKNLLAVRETQLQTLGQEDPLENARATHSSILAWRIPWTEEPGRLQSMGRKESI